MPPAPFKLSSGQPVLPDGSFLLPVCTTRDRVLAMLSALNWYKVTNGATPVDFDIDILEALHYVDKPETAPCVPCSDVEASCVAFYPNRSDRFEFSPGVINGNPDIGEEVPLGYAQHPFFTGDRYTVPGFQLRSTDVLGDGNSFRPADVIGIIQQITYSGFPRFRFHWTGEATIELHLIGVPFGGGAVVRVDDGIDADWIDMTSITPSDLDFSFSTIVQLIDGLTELNFVPVQIHEIEVTTPGDHYVDVLFVWNIEASLNPIGWGGGVRKVVVCGKDMNCEQQECPDDIDDPCGCNDCTDSSTNSNCDDCKGYEI